ncbi:hypothetical protein HID58_025299 [Brassica napus]|uniref:Uncharacterized protein n=1 Tax=Brassica napus TaxID=3708 RepID=A0ABQ8CKQ8_BRANA|nr:hypothetical protein HID58_025299 [Brassica napus]
MYTSARTFNNACTTSIFISLRLLRSWVSHNREITQLWNLSTMAYNNVIVTHFWAINRNTNLSTCCETCFHNSSHHRLSSTPCGGVSE